MRPNDTPELDNALVRVLGGNDEIEPSSGFAASVMETVRREAAEPEPIPFPWKWLLPGLAVCVGMVAYAVLHWVESGAGATSDVAGAVSLRNVLSMPLSGWTEAPIGMGMEWSVAAVAISLIAVWLTLRLTGGSE